MATWQNQQQSFINSKMALVCFAKIVLTVVVVEFVSIWTIRHATTWFIEPSLTFRPKRLPRSDITVRVVYHPLGRPVEGHKNLNKYLITITDYLRNKYPDHGLDLLGNFNDFAIGNLASNHNLRQFVQQSTWNSSILDLIITNMHT